MLIIPIQEIKPCVQDGIVIEDDEGETNLYGYPIGDIKNKDGNNKATITH